MTTTTKRPPVMTRQQLATRIREAFAITRTAHSTSAELHAATEAIYAELRSRTPAGRLRYPASMLVYARGYADALHADIWRNRVEFVYREPGSDVLYSTWRQSSHRSTQALYDRNLTSAQWDALERAHVWRDTSWPFTPFTTGEAES